MSGNELSAITWLYYTRKTCSCGKHYAKVVKPACRDLIPFRCEGISWRPWWWVARPGLWSVFRLSHRFFDGYVQLRFSKLRRSSFRGPCFVCRAFLCRNSKQTFPSIAKKLEAHKGLIGTKDLRWTMKFRTAKQQYKIYIYYHLV